MDFKLLDEREVAALTSIRISTLQYFRRVGGGPKYSKLGRLVRYRLSDVAEWVANNLHVSAAG